MNIIIKYLLTAAIVVAVSELAKKSDKLGALLVALPIVTILSMIWLHLESKAGGDISKVANHAYYTFWYVIPTLPMFIVLSILLKKGMSFWLSMMIYILGTWLIFYLFNIVLKRFGIYLV